MKARAAAKGSKVASKLFNMICPAVPNYDYVYRREYSLGRGMTESKHKLIKFRNGIILFDNFQILIGTSRAHCCGAVRLALEISIPDFGPQWSSCSEVSH